MQWVEDIFQGRLHRAEIHRHTHRIELGSAEDHLDLEIVPVERFIRAVIQAQLVRARKCAGDTHFVRHGQTGGQTQRRGGILFENLFLPLLKVLLVSQKLVFLILQKFLIHRVRFRLGNDINFHAGFVVGFS